MGRVLLGVGVGTLALSFWQFWHSEIPTLPTWLLFGFGLIFWIAGVLWLTSAVPNSQLRGDWILFGIILVAIAVRVYRLKDFPYGILIDESLQGIEARKLSHDYLPIYMPNQNITLPHLLFYRGLLEIFGENSITAMRLASVGFGVAGVMVGYGVGKLLFHRIVGLWMALFLAVLSWSVTFSRFAITGIELPFFILLTIYFLLRLLQTGKTRMALWAGLAMGSGLWFYMAFRPIAALLYLVGMGIFFRRWRQETLQVGLLMGITILLVIFPLLIYANGHEAIFFQRPRQVSIFEPENRQHETVAIAFFANLVKHTLMFHVKGDPNVPFNIPDRPMLDPITGILFLIGVFMLMREHRPEILLLLLPLPIALLVSSTTTEQYAPYAGRSLGALPTLAGLASFGVYSIGQKASIVKRGSPILVLSIVGLNGWWYHSVQARHYENWAYTASGRIITEVAQDQFERGSALWFSNRAYPVYTMDFLAPTMGSHVMGVDLLQLLPLRDEIVQPVAILIRPEESWFYEYAQTVYPNARFSEYRVMPNYALTDLPEAIPIATYVVELNPTDNAQVRGLDRDGNGLIYIPIYGEYRFQAEDLQIDGQAIHETAKLAQGLHRVKVAGDWLWLPPDHTDFEPIPDTLLYHGFPLQGVIGYFYANENWVGPPDLIRHDPNVSSYFHVLPLDRPYTVIWSADLLVPETGEYHFGVQVVGEVSLYLKHRPILASPQTIAHLYLEKGTYPLEIWFRDTMNYSSLYVRWKPPSQPWGALPTAALRPNNLDTIQN